MRYAINGGYHLVIDRIDLTIAPRHFVAIVGPTGCGKTTLINLIAGFLQPSEGEIRIGGKLVRNPSPRAVVVSQDYSLFSWKTVAANIAFGLKANGFTREEIDRRVRHYLELVRLAAFAGHYPLALSGGMRQRVALARALAVEPKCLLLDEPLGALDAQMRQHMQDEILAIWAHTGQTVVLVTHDIEEAIYLADEVVVMRHDPGRVGNITATGFPRPRPPDLRLSDAFHIMKQRIYRDLQPARDR